MYQIVLLLASTTVSSAIFDSLFLSFENNCTHKEFVCSDKKCIPIARRCDKINDCVDGFDESDCELYLCEDPFFRCKNKRCISKSFVCDGENDCEDFSDEVNCEDFKKSLGSNTTCETEMWQCTDKLCIPEEWVCNGESDCLDGSDETIGCSAHIECDGFKCKNGHCIPSEWVCDKHDDCNDNSDELNCENHVPRAECTVDNQKFLCSNNHTCIPLHQACDGHQQCPDGSDESPLCQNPNFSCKRHNCSHTCVALPTGPMCVCPKGYHTINDKRCEDINECEIYGICDQKCTNTPGSYECDCDHKYILQEDKRTCKVVGGEAMMVFSSKTEVRGYMLSSELYFPIAKNLKQVIGVAFDGNHVYWSDIFLEHESIVRVKEDGSGRELLVTSGLGLPEDLAIDWMTNNLYFTDAEKQHIGVCTNDGAHCTVLINEDIRKPRAIVLNVDEGTMYWTDWGEPSEIGFASMDGSNHSSFVKDNIHWPNGLALDYPNNRLYWTDARRMTLESIRLDGTDRRIVLEGIVKHPYAIAVFENRLYWSDWATRSIQSCDKFTGKNHETIVKEKREFIYGLSIYHSALRKRLVNPCALAFCSDICLLNGASYTCACPQDKVLESDKHTCQDVEKPQMLILGVGHTLVHLEHQILGRHDVTALPSVAQDIGALAFDSVQNILYISDLSTKKILTLNMNDGKVKHLNIFGVGGVTCMDYDHLANNLYYCDDDKATVEVLNLHSNSQTVLLHDLNGEKPESIALIPYEGVMYVALRRADGFHSHIDRFHMDGSGRTHTIDKNLQGPISLYFDYGSYRVYWADAGKGNIESTSMEGDDRHSFRSLSTTPISITGLSSEIFWVNKNSRRIYWAEKKSQLAYNKKITLDIPEGDNRMHIISVSSKVVTANPCQINNGNCSHLCLLSLKTTSCSCPIGMYLTTDNKTCYERTTCNSAEFYCHKSNSCILKSFKCNGHKECPNGEDEEHCLEQHCPIGHFQCKDGNCIEEFRRCDHHFDCHDNSDEEACDVRMKIETVCPLDHVKCGDGQCISERFICDGTKDCNDGADEADCFTAVCEDHQFRCQTGACIPKSWECDHEYDCSDFSDEHNKCVFASCASTMFTCNNGKCIDKKLQCDQSDDCGDGSDESTQCDQHEKESICSPQEFACTSNSSICVHLSARCNGTSECPHHEDEKDCSECHVDEFNCKNGRCISAQWLCDKFNDCGDNSDESAEHCNQTAIISPMGSSGSCENGFRCASGNCIERSQVCDGKRHCFDGSDEDGQCSTACNEHPCEQECMKTPSGSSCKCRPGYRLAGDGHRCLDIDECKSEPEPCAQKCYNKLGNFSCDCFDGYLIRSDRRSCKAKGTPLSLVFTVDNEIRELVQQSNSLRVLYDEDSPKITGLAINQATNFVYFSIKDSATIHRINRVSQVREYIKHVGQPGNLAVDYSTNNIYYVNEINSDKMISICNFDEKVCTKIISVDRHRDVSSLVVDSRNRVMFYSLTSWWVFNTPSFVLYKCNLDGTGKHELVKSTAGFISGLAVDINKQQLYYVDKHQGKITRVSYDGNHTSLVLENLIRPKGLAFFEDHLYYMLNGGLVSKCKLYDTKQCDSFRVHSYSADLFALSQEVIQPQMMNPCHNHTCSYMCVPRSDGHFKCLCEDGIVISEKAQCAPMQQGDGTTIKYHKVDARARASSGSIAAAIIVPLCLILVGTVLYWIARRRNSGKLNISMRFYNPSYGQDIDETTDDSKPILQPGRHEYLNPVHFNHSLNASPKVVD